MWILTKEQTQEKYILLPHKSQYTVGRVGPDLILNDDLCISRKHAQFYLSNNATELHLEDIGSKYGTFCNVGIADNKALPKNTKITIKDGDKIRFGVLGNIWKVTNFKIVTMSSALTELQNKRFQEAIKLLAGDIVETWDINCTHLTMSEMVVTVKLLHALLDQALIVNCNYWLSLIKSAESGIITNNWPKPENYEPRHPEDMNIKPCSKRKTLFQGKTFIFMHRKHFNMYGPIVQKAGGMIKDLNSGVKKNFLTKPNVIIIQYVPTTLSQSTETINYIISILENHSLRAIPEYEIGLAIINSSIERYCNPYYKTIRDILPLTKNTEPKVQSGTMLAENTAEENNTNNSVTSNEFVVLETENTNTESKVLPEHIEIDDMEYDDIKVPKILVAEKNMGIDRNNMHRQRIRSSDESEINQYNVKNPDKKLRESAAKKPTIETTNSKQSAHNDEYEDNLVQFNSNKPTQKAKSTVSDVANDDENELFQFVKSVPTRSLSVREEKIFDDEDDALNRTSLTKENSLSNEEDDDNYNDNELFQFKQMEDKMQKETIVRTSTRLSTQTADTWQKTVSTRTSAREEKISNDNDTLFQFKSKKPRLEVNIEQKEAAFTRTSLRRESLLSSKEDEDKYGLSQFKKRQSDLKQMDTKEQFHITSTRREKRKRMEDKMQKETTVRMSTRLSKQTADTWQKTVSTRTSARKEKISNDNDTLFQFKSKKPRLEVNIEQKEAAFTRTSLRRESLLSSKEDEDKYGLSQFKRRQSDLKQVDTKEQFHITKRKIRKRMEDKMQKETTVRMSTRLLKQTAEERLSTAGQSGRMSQTEIHAQNVASSQNEQSFLGSGSESSLVASNSRESVKHIAKRSTPSSANKSRMRSLPLVRMNKLENVLEKIQPVTSSTQITHYNQDKTEEVSKEVITKVIGNIDNEDSDVLFNFGRSTTRNPIKESCLDDKSSDDELFQFKNRPKTMKADINRPQLLISNKEDLIETQPYVPLTNCKSTYVTVEPKQLPSKISINGCLKESCLDDKSSDDELFQFKNRPKTMKADINRPQLLTSNKEDLIERQPYVPLTNCKSTYVTVNPKQLPSKISINGWLSCSIKKEELDDTDMAKKEFVQIYDTQKQWLQTLENAIEIKRCTPNTSLRNAELFDQTNSTLSNRKSYKLFVKNFKPQLKQEQRSIKLTPYTANIKA